MLGPLVVRDLIHPLEIKKKEGFFFVNSTCLTFPPYIRSSD